MNLWKYHAARLSFSALKSENLKYNLRRLLCCSGYHNIHIYIFIHILTVIVSMSWFLYISSSFSHPSEHYRTGFAAQFSDFLFKNQPTTMLIDGFNKKYKAMFSNWNAYEKVNDQEQFLKCRTFPPAFSLISTKHITYRHNYANSEIRNRVIIFPPSESDYEGYAM